MNPSAILIWNVRGLNKIDRRNAVRDVILSSNADIVCLQETKVANLTQQVLLSVFGTVYDNFVALPAVGTRGGVLVAWKGGSCQAVTSRVDNFSVSVLFAEQEGRNWWLTGVYGPQGDDEKVLFLQELRNIRALCNGPWLVAGDFNLIYQAADKNNANLDRAMMGRFRRFLDDNDLLEIPLLGRKYAWSNERRSPTLVRLDTVPSVVMAGMAFFLMQSCKVWRLGSLIIVRSCLV
jgi:exonuclease III